MVKFVHRCEIIRVKLVWIFPRLPQRGKNPLFEGELGIVTCDIRFDTYDVPPSGTVIM
jgi:hypothetical protein